MKSERGWPWRRWSSVSEDTIVHSQMPGFTQGIARMTSNNEAFRLNLLGRVGHRRKVEPMAQWPAPDPQDWQPPAPASPAAKSEESWTPPTWEELVRDHGGRMRRELEAISGVEEVRGRGLMIGIGLAAGTDAAEIRDAVLALETAPSARVFANVLSEPR